MERYYEKIHIDPTTTKCWLDSVLEDQGLEYKDGEIVKIEQPPEKDYEDLSITEGDEGVRLYFTKDGRGISDFSISKDTARWLHGKLGEYLEMHDEQPNKKNHEGMSITIPDDLKGTDPDGGVVGEKGEEGEPLIEDDRIRKAILSGMNFLKFQGRETFGGIAIDDCIAWLKKQSIKEDSPETKAIKEYIENLKKRIEDNQLGCIVQRLNKIIELLQSAILVIPKEPYVPPITYTTENTFGADYDIDTDKIKQDETDKPES